MDLQTTDLVLSDVNDSLAIYGSAGDDLFEFELGQNSLVRINDQPIRIDLPEGVEVRFVGGQGDDRLVCSLAGADRDLWMYPHAIRYGEQRTAIYFDSMETVESVATVFNSNVNLFDSPGDDRYDVFQNQSILQTPDVSLIASGFRYGFGRSRNGQDTAHFHDTELNDRVFTDLDLVLYRSGAVVNRSRGFADVRVESGVGNDVHTIQLSAGVTQCVLLDGETWSVVSAGDRSFEASGAWRCKIKGLPEVVDAVGIEGGPAVEALTLEGNSGIIVRDGFTCFLESIEQVTADKGDNDILRVIDTSGNDVVQVTGGSVTYSGDSFTHNVEAFGSLRAFSRNGGSDQAFVGGASIPVVLVGDWQQ